MDADRRLICELTLKSDWFQWKVEDRLISAVNGVSVLEEDSG
jgi:hypothetical protein